MRYISMFSGIEAASLAFLPLGWEPICFAEIDRFASAVLAHHHPDVPNVGDVTAHDWTQSRGSCELVIGGPPCQAFSVAGLRRSLADERGNLSLAYLKAVHAIRPVWCVTENVPGWLNTPDNAFGCFLAGIVGADDALPCPTGGGWPGAGMVAGPGARAAWRILDAQYFNLPQRRARVFVVAGFGDWADPAAVLFERKSLQGHSPPRREAGQRVARPVASSPSGGSGYRNDADTAENLIAPTLDANYGKLQGCSGQDLNHGHGHLIANTLSAARGAACAHADLETYIPVAYGGNNTAGPIEVATAVNAHGGPHGRLDFESETFVACEPVFPIAEVDAGWNSNGTGIGAGGDPAPTLQSGKQHAVAYRTSPNCGVWETGDRTDALTTSTDRSSHLVAQPVHCFDARQSDVIQHGDKTVPLDTDGHTHTIAFDTYNQTVTGDVTHALRDPNGTFGDALPAIAFDTTQITSRENRCNPQAGDPYHPLAAGAHAPAVAFQASQSGMRLGGDTHPTLDGNNGSRRHHGARVGSAVRRLTPTECERLQGFPDDWTLIPWRGALAPDGPRYRALGNSFAVPVVRWIGQQIAAVESILHADRSAA
jgi:DNA (cytosine-5)-methyltransferase 1